MFFEPRVIFIFMLVLLLGIFIYYGFFAPASFSAHGIQLYPSSVEKVSENANSVTLQVNFIDKGIGSECKKTEKNWGTRINFGDNKNLDYDLSGLHSPEFVSADFNNFVINSWASCGGGEYFGKAKIINKKVDCNDWLSSDPHCYLSFDTETQGGTGTASGFDGSFRIKFLKDEVSHEEITTSESSNEDAVSEKSFIDSNKENDSTSKLSLWDRINKWIEDFVNKLSSWK